MRERRYRGKDIKAYRQRKYVKPTHKKGTTENRKRKKDVKLASSRNKFPD